MLLKEPVLKYPDPSKPYTLFTDASKYAWACVLTQEYEHEFDGKVRKILYPITYVSGLFKGSQVNWAILTKEAYAIYSTCTQSGAPPTLGPARFLTVFRGGKEKYCL